MTGLRAPPLTASTRTRPRLKETFLLGDVPRFAGGQRVAKIAQDLAAGDVAREHDEWDAAAWLGATTGEVGVA